MENKVHAINIAEEFAVYPGGRYRKDGPFSGEEFRDDLLVPMLKEIGKSYDRVVVVLDGVKGFAGSFLDEAFAGLIRKGLLDKSAFGDKLLIKTDDRRLSVYVDLVNEYVRDARRA